MSLSVRSLSLLALLLCAVPLRAQAPAPANDAAQAMVGAWEISNADRDKRCAVSFSVDPAPPGLKLDLDTACADALPALKDIAAWALGPNDAVRLLDPAGVVVLDFGEVESGLYEAERKGEGLYFLQTQAAIKAETKSAEELFGDWKVLRELDKPLCILTLSNAANGDDGYKLIVKPGCELAIAVLGLSTWRFDRGQLLLTGRNTSWRFAESDSVTWERIPLSVDPLLLMRQ